MIRVLTRDNVEKALPMTAAIEAVKSAFVQLSENRADMPVRSSLEVPAHDGVTLIMPGYLRGDDAVAVKIVSVFNDNPTKGLPRIHALVVVVDAETGRPEAVMDGTCLTALRTGAASGAATEALAREDASIAAIVGAGAQGRTQLEAVCAVRPIQQAWVYDIDQRQAEVTCAEMEEHLDLPVEPATSVAEAVSAADVICTATTSSTPVFDDADVGPGTHINAVGAYTPEMQEIPPETVLQARLVVDHRESALAEAGDLLIPMKQGLFDEAHIHAELGEIIAGTRTGRTSETQITLFKSVGVAVQDVAAASAVLAAAISHDLGMKATL